MSLHLLQLPRATTRSWPPFSQGHHAHLRARLAHACPTLLNHGSLLDGRSWFLEAYNKVWKQQLVRHSNGGGGNATTPFEEPDNKQSEAGRARQRANSAAKEEISTLKAMWSCSHPHVRHFAAKWGGEGMEGTLRQAFQGQP
jgi:hypothetical protein